MNRTINCGNHTLSLGKRTLIMGTLNVTPDSFSDGGRFLEPEKALEQAHYMADEGADLIDIGGESTRPGATPIPAEEELRRVIPVIKAIIKEINIPLSIDTYKSSVAEKALQEGVQMVNDVWGLKADSAMADIIAKYDVPVCLMHNREKAIYEDVISEVISDLQDSINMALNAGITANNIIIDPGIGFGKTLDHNLEVMHHLDRLKTLNFPILLGTSRKSLIGKILDLPTSERLEGTAATVAYGITKGVDIVRVHDIREMRRVVMMTDAIVKR